MNIVGLFQPVRSKLTAALAMITRIRQQDSITMVHKNPGIAQHSFAIVSDSVRQQHHVAVVFMRADVPPFQHDSVGGPNTDILNLRLVMLLHVCHNLPPMRDRSMKQPETALGAGDPRHYSKQQVNAGGDHKNLNRLDEPTHGISYGRRAWQVPYLANSNWQLAIGQSFIAGFTDARGECTGLGKIRAHPRKSAVRNPGYLPIASFP